MSLPAGDTSYPRHAPSSPLSSRSAAGGPILFKAPAHKHAHHLHSIPPREKSTRTLIIDHCLWVHARTRFAQARAELGMTDRTGGPSSYNYAHRERPENYEEDDEVYSEGEDVHVLTARSGGPGHTHGDEDDERLDSQDLTLARSLRLRAESVEKVVASMLDQKPAVPPVHPDELDFPTSPRLQPQTTRNALHTLPNGVRLRLALATVINDLFARRAPSPKPRSAIRPLSSSARLPSSLVPLSAVSSASFSTAPNIHPPLRKPVPNDYIRSIYDIGADPDTQNSPPSLRCPRHLHMSCQICVEVTVRPGYSKGKHTSGRTTSASGNTPSDGGSSQHGGNALVGGVTGWQDGSGIGSGLARPGPKGTVLRRPSDASLPDDAVRSSQTGLAMANTKLAELVVRFIRLSALVAVELGREATEDGVSVEGGKDDERESAPSSTPRPPASSPVMSARVPHRQVPEMSVFSYALRPSREWYFLLAGLLTRAVFEGYMTAGWRGIDPLEVLLGIGLGLTPSTLPKSKGKNRTADTRALGEDGHDDEFTEFDPDDLPDLDDSMKILFPTLRDMTADNPHNYLRREGAELEYEVEMIERLGRFYAVPGTTPDLATHMEDLAWQFPAEPVERAAVRFCEAIARWRGKPELETYKNASWIVGEKDNLRPSGAAMSIDSLVHSNPASPSIPSRMPVTDPHHSARKQRKPSIEKYFTVPSSLAMHGRKRRRSETDRADDGRRVNVSSGYMHG